ncbi:MAG: hypothetical protein M3R08_04220 [Bacteroidota bacterium]|nr:hypothetical protein [Bacteroidota bacterium]
MQVKVRSGGNARSMPRSPALLEPWVGKKDQDKHGAKIGSKLLIVLLIGNAISRSTDQFACMPSFLASLSSLVGL